MTEFWRSHELPFIEARRSCQHNICYRLHSHEEFSIGVVDKGTSLFAGNLQGSIRLEAGDVIAIPAGHVHSCNPLHSEWRYQMFHFDQSWVADLVGRTQQAAALDCVRVIRDETTYLTVDHLGDVLFSDASRQEIDALVLQTLLRLGQAPAVREVLGGRDDVAVEALSPVFYRLRDDPANPRVSELGALVGMNEFELIRAFRAAVGLPPLAWRQNYRIAQARRLLREGCSIVETATSLGFADQSHFHRVFRGHVAATPGGYRS